MDLHLDHTVGPVSYKGIPFTALTLNVWQYDDILWCYQFNNVYVI